MKTFTICLMLITPGVVLAQDAIEKLEKQLDQKHGIGRLKILNQITEGYLVDEPKKSAKYARQAVILADDIFKGDGRTLYEDDLSLHAESYLLLGKAQYTREKYDEAKEAYEESIRLSKSINDPFAVEMAQRHLSALDSIKQDEGGLLKNTFGKLKIGEEIKDKTGNLATTVALKQGQSAEKQGNYLKAIKHYERAIELFSNQGDYQAISEYSQHIALLYQKAGNNKEALNRYEKVLDRKEQLGDTSGLQVIREQLAELERPIDASDLVQDSQWDEKQKEEATKEKDLYRSLAESSEDNRDYKKSLEYYKLYTQLNTRLKDEEQAQLMALREKTYQLEKQAQEMAILETEKEVQALVLSQQDAQLLKDQTFKRNLLLGMLFLLVAVLVTFFLYRGKRRALGELNNAYGDLKDTQDKLVTAEDHIKTLLHQQVSSGVASQLLNNKNTDKAQKKFVCVMFLDIRGFTPFAEHREPEEIIRYQNDVFGFMIDIIDQHQGSINQFLGDGFMATFGLQEAEANPCEHAYLAAKEIITLVNKKSKEGVIPTTRVGIGLHAGNVVAGNVGTAIRKQYSITGNTVITAARIEQLNKEFESQLLISREVFKKLNHPIDLPEDFVEVRVKGRKKPVELLKIA
ncbi:MAG: adenylate/guanylate cyclase domain-containing protein [Cyclobacteriaceae bacterium]